MTYFITTKQIVEYEAELERPISQKERTTNGKKKNKKKQVSCILWKPKYTQLENEEPSPPVKGPAII